jgi:microcystin-dependent protein
MEPFIAQIMMFGGNFAPRGWAFCEGQLLPISNNAALFSLIGTIYGGDGRTTFALPDMRGRSPIGQGHGSGLTPRPFGQRGGVESVTLNQLQMPSHTHSAGSLSVRIPANSSDGDSNDPTNRVLASPVFTNEQRQTIAVNAYADNGNTQMAAAQAAGSTNNTGGNQPHENMPPFQVIPFVIALQGVFPSRN